MPDHVHVVMKPHHNKPKRVIGHLKGNATRQMYEAGVHPFGKYEGLPSPWGRGGWAVYLDTEEAVHAAIRYVEQNPIEAGLPQQVWPFCVSPRV
jgi:REP element-mobilizing transposase RayT